MRLQIGARTESVARARENSDAKLWVIAKIGLNLAQPKMHFEIDGVFHLRAVERDIGDLALLFV
jgi:hypothetical protein